MKRRYLNPLNWALPLKLIAIIILVMLFGEYVSLDVKRFLYSLSLTIKEALVFVLPVIIFSYLSSCILSFKKGVVTFLFILFAIVYISNFCSTIIGYFASILTLDKISIATSSEISPDRILVPFWDLHLPVWISNTWALLSGLVIGLIFTFIRVKFVEHATEKLRAASTFFLMRIFIPLMPIFILGFMIKLEHEGELKNILISYAPLFFLIFAVELAYILVLIAIVTKFNPSRFFTYIRNSLAAVITGFSTMSSAATLPLTLQAAERNTGNKNLADAVIPATVNIHMIGNMITIPMLAFAMLIIYGLPFPSFSDYFTFALQVALAQFTVAAVPGGGIIMMYPYLSQYLGLDHAMLGVLYFIYTLFDASLTSSNILGNIALASFLNRILTKFKIIPTGEPSKN